MVRSTTSSRAPTVLAPAADRRRTGFTGCDALDPAGVDRINGLTGHPAFPSTSGRVTRQPSAALSASGSCPLAGTVWGEGDILLGGGGSDTHRGPWRQRHHRR